MTNPQISSYLLGHRCPSDSFVLSSPFFHGHLNRVMAESYILVCPYPIFRPSSVSGCIAVTYLYQGTIRHSLLRLVENSFQIVDAHGYVWNDACQLIDALLSNNMYSDFGVIGAGAAAATAATVTTTILSEDPIHVVG